MLTELETRFVEIVAVAQSLSRLTWVSIAVGGLFALLFFKIFFRAPGSFESDLSNSTNDPCPFWPEYLKRLFDGNYVDRQWSKLKLFIWIALSVLGGWAAHHKLPLLFPNFFP